jgi:hypothetical protein
MVWINELKTTRIWIKGSNESSVQETRIILTP